MNFATVEIKNDIPLFACRRRDPFVTTVDFVDPRDATYACVVEKRNRLRYATGQRAFDVAERPGNLIGRESPGHAGILRTANGLREK